MAVPSTRPLAEELASEYSGREEYVEVQFSEGSYDEVLAALAAQRADVAIVERRPAEVDLLHPDSGRPILRAWPLATDLVAVVVHSSNPVQNLTTEQLLRIFEGLERRWTGVGGPDEPIRLVCREPGAPARSVFEAHILGEKQIAGTAVVMAGEEALAARVAKDPTAIGYLSVAWVGGRVKAVALDGLLPQPGMPANAYPLTNPVVILTRTGPASKVRAFIDYCHGVDGQGIVGRFYALPG
jgi:phosphate transport system substrate-binding protein